MPSGHLALILHAHLPFVRHPEQEHFLEEEWFFEAITETYIPLLRMMQRLVDDAVPFKVTMSITPTLCAMLQDRLLWERYVRHVDLSLDLAAREQRRNRKHQQLRGLADFYFELFSENRRLFIDEWKCDLLPLPECAYASGLETILQEANLRWFVIGAHGLLSGKPLPFRSIYAPCYTPAGPAAFARDPDASRQVWSAHEGYPGDPAYREFYRDIGFDLPIEHLGPAARGMRKFSGVKYHRITGQCDDKQLYDRVAAKNAAAKHAIHFFGQCHQQIREIGKPGLDPIIVAPFDAELFGHWWFEGPIFLEQFIRHLANKPDFQFTTPSEYLAAHPTQQIIEPAASTWGENGHLAVWLDPSNAWIYPHLQVAAQKMSELARKYGYQIVGQRRKRSGLPGAGLAGDASALKVTDRVLKQLARELLLAQSSDWAFLMKTGTAREYATKRTIDHLARFNRLHDQCIAKNIDEEFLGDCEWRDNIFPKVNWRYYA